MRGSAGGIWGRTKALTDRETAEIKRLAKFFRGMLPRIPEMLPLLDSLRTNCMSELTFDEVDFKKIVKGVMDSTPNMTRLLVRLSFNVVGRANRMATLFFATTLACVANRPEESKALETLVLDHVSDTTILDICNNPMDLRNALASFASLKHLALSIKRQELTTARQRVFAQNLWFLIHKAVDLESLCLIGWNAKRDINTRKHRHLVAFSGEDPLVSCFEQLSDSKSRMGHAVSPVSHEGTGQAS